VLVGLVIVDREFAELLGLFLKLLVGTAQVLLEVGDFVPVGVQLALCLVLVDREVQAELLQDLNGSLVL